MADEIKAGASPGADLLSSPIVRRGLLLKLADRASLRNHPALINLGGDLIGGVSEKVNVLGLDGSDLMSSVAEAASVANTALTEAQATVTPAMHRLKYEYTDQMGAHDPTGAINSARLGLSIVGSAMMTLTNLIAKEGDDFTQTGSTGVAFSHDTFIATKAALIQALVPGPYLMVFKPKSFTDWMTDLESRGGLTQWNPAASEMQVLRGGGFQGVYDGCEIFTSDQVQGLNTNADWGNFMFGRGAIGYKEVAQGAPKRSQFVVLDLNGVIRVAEMRTEDAGTTSVVGHYYVGTAIIEAGRGRTALGAQ
tara:strand:+ start:1302 stop:2225 length:924 start_codon:yes stop_codon:yes gene_type:complete